MREPSAAEVHQNCPDEAGICSRGLDHECPAMNPDFHKCDQCGATWNAPVIGCPHCKAPPVEGAAGEPEWLTRWRRFEYNGDIRQACNYIDTLAAENSRLRGEITRLESSHADLNKDYIALEQSYADLSAERQLSGRVVPEKVLWDAIAALERSEHHVTGKQKSDAAMALRLATAPKEDRHGR